jgi:hypothetical protein
MTTTELTDRYTDHPEYRAAAEKLVELQTRLRDIAQSQDRLRSNAVRREEIGRLQSKAMQLLGDARDDTSRQYRQTANELAEESRVVAIAIDEQRRRMSQLHDRLSREYCESRRQEVQAVAQSIDAVLGDLEHALAQWIDLRSDLDASGYLLGSLPMPPFLPHDNFDGKATFHRIEQFRRECRDAGYID